MLCRDCGNAMIYVSKTRISCLCKVSKQQLYDIYDEKKSFVVLNCTDKVPKKQPEQEAQ